MILMFMFLGYVNCSLRLSAATLKNFLEPRFVDDALHREKKEDNFVSLRLEIQIQKISYEKENFPFASCLNHICQRESNLNSLSLAAE